MNFRTIIILAAMIFLLFPASVTGQEWDVNDEADSIVYLQPSRLSFNGYIKDLPMVEYNNIENSAGFSNIFHNRLNFGYGDGKGFSAALEMRNRVFSGQIIGQNRDLMVESLKQDIGLINASFVPANSKYLVMHSNFDRFYIDWQKDKWQVRLGRQRINWGVTMAFNPNDLFNTYSFFDFDYEERPGADALRVQYYHGDMSRYEIAFSPGKEWKNSVAAFMGVFNKGGYDIQYLAGYYRDRIAVGLGSAGNIMNSGFKAEATLFSSISKPDSLTLVVSAGIDHLFGNGLYGFLELLYNGGNTGDSFVMDLTRPMSADNILFSRYAAVVSLMYPVSPVFSTSFSAMYMPDISAAYFLPGLTYSAMTNLDISLLLQYFYTSDKDFAVFGTDYLSQMNVYLQGKWSF